MTVLKFLATKMALERCPYPPDSRDGQAWITGFVATVLPKRPSKWEVGFVLALMTPPIFAGAAIGAILGYCLIHYLP